MSSLRVPGRGKLKTIWRKPVNICSACLAYVTGRAGWRLTTGPSRLPHSHIRHFASLHLMDVRERRLPRVRTDSDIAAKRLLQLKKQHQNGDDDSNYRGGHQ